MAEISKEPHVALAIIASRLYGKATFLICSDSLTCSGHLHFADGALASGSIYGWEGSDELWTFSSTAFQTAEIELSASGGFNYYSPVAAGLIESIGPGADELFLSPDSGEIEGETFRYLIMSKRQKIFQVVAQREH